MHRYLEKYPNLYRDLVFINYNFLPEKFEPFCSFLDMSGTEIYDTIGRHYLEATDEEVLFTHYGQECPEEEADTFWLATGMNSDAGKTLWLKSVLNKRPGGNRWYGAEVVEGDPILDNTGESDHLKRNTSEGHRYINDYPEFRDLIYLNTNMLPSTILPLAKGCTITDKWALYNKISETYAELSDDDITCTLNGFTSSDEEADTLVMPTGFFTESGSAIMLYCVRNTRQNATQLWFCNNILPDISAIEHSGTGHRYLSRYPVLFDRLLFADWTMLERHIKPLTNLSCSAIDIYNMIGQHYLIAHDDEIKFTHNGSLVDESEADTFILNTGLKTVNGDDILLSSQRNNKPDQRSVWYCNKVFTSADSFGGKEPGKWLYSWACMYKSYNDKNMDPILADLKALAVNEEWDYAGESDNYILRNYLQYTFVKLWNENKISYSADNSYAAFNTGLVNRVYEYIYAVFERIRDAAPNGWQWKIIGFCAAGTGTRGLGKTLVRNFNPLPAAAKYFDKSGNMIYDLDFDQPVENQIPQFDYEHILFQRCERLGINFFKNQAYDYPELLELLDTIENTTTYEEQKELWREVGKFIEEEDELLVRYKDRLHDALKKAVKRVAWNYRTAIPYYSPANDKNCLLLPLYLTSRDTPDVAMVIEQLSIGTYYGHTIITLDMAYNNARLVCKPDNDWLSPSSIESDRLDDEE